MTELDHDSLPTALARHHIDLPGEQIEQLDAYCRQLWDWNTRLNLTRHTDYEKFVARDVVDCLNLARLLRTGEQILDVGSGGGVPGVVLAILRPDLEVWLAESVRKKSEVLRQITAALNLPVAVHHCRAEEVLDQFRFDAVVARAVGPLDRMLSWFAPHWQSIGRLLAIKGPRWSVELADAKELLARAQLTAQCVARFPMPGTESESVILEIRRRVSESRPT